MYNCLKGKNVCLNYTTNRALDICHYSLAACSKSSLICWVVAESLDKRLLLLQQLLKLNIIYWLLMGTMI